MRTNTGLSKFALSCALLVGLLAVGSIPGLARDKNETIDATAWGTSTQLGRNVGITIIIYQYSTPEDQDVLTEAFQKGQNQGLVNALEKMKAVGHISITGTLGYDLSFIKLIQTPTGSTIRFVTNRPIRFGEAYYDTQSQYYNLTAGEINIDNAGQEQERRCAVSCRPVDDRLRWSVDVEPEQESVAAWRHHRLGRYIWRKLTRAPGPYWRCYPRSRVAPVTGFPWLLSRSTVTF